MQVYDDIPASIAKELINSYITPLTQLINRSFLNQLKLAKVISVFKSGSSLSPSNYRPKSILPFFGKIFERIMYNKLYYAFINKYDILYEYKFGFTREYSTNHVIITLVNRLTQSLDSGKMVIGVLVPSLVLS